MSRPVALTWSTGSVIVDASLNEQHVKSAQVTDHQVETGLNATDHIRPLPGKLSLDLVVTNTPLGVPPTQNRGVTGRVQPVTRVVNGQTLTYSAFQFDGQFDRVADVYADLFAAIEAAELFDIFTTLNTYKQYACTNMVVTRNAEKGNALFFTIEFTQIRIVTTQTVAALPPRTQKKRIGSKAGRTLDEKDPADAQKISALDQLLHGVSNLFSQ